MLGSKLWMEIQEGDEPAGPTLIDPVFLGSVSINRFHICGAEITLAINCFLKNLIEFKKSS